MTRALYFLLIILFIVYTNGQTDRKSSLTFVIDVTKSMEKVRKQVEQNAHALFDAVIESNESYIEDFVLVTFADPIALHTSVNNVTKTKDRDEFKNSLQLTLVKGGDCPEHSMSGLQTGIENSLPGSTIYVFTDASAKDFKIHKQVINLAQKKEIQVVFVLTNICNIKIYGKTGYEVYEKIANETSGQVFNLLKRNHVSDILKFVKDSAVARRIQLANLRLPAGNHTFNYTTDISTNDTSISYTGTHATLVVNGLDGKSLKTMSLVNLDNIGVVKVNETNPGTQTVQFDSTSGSHIVVTAKSSIQFRHGFSVYVPTSLNDTTVKPPPGYKSYLSIQIFGKFRPDTVNLLDASDNLIPGYTFSLKLASESTQTFFLTDPFDPPTSKFRIKITGLDLINNATISRLSTALIQLQDPSLETPKNTKPTVTIVGSPKITVELDSAQQLKCFVNAYPKPNITWENNGTILETNVAAFDLPYNYISIHKIESVKINTTYVCKATNMKGENTQSVVVETKPKNVFTIIKKPEDATIKYNNTGFVKCKLDTYPPANITWYKNGVILTKDDNIVISENGSEMTIQHMQPDDVGNYACEVKNDFHEKTFSFDIKISGVDAPIIEKIGSSLYFKEGTNGLISCRIKKGTPKPKILWYNKDIFGEFVEMKDAKNDEDLTLIKVKETHSGTYKCVASNEYGNDTIETDVIVEYAPSVDNNTDPITVKTNEEVILVCNVSGVPEPVVKWSKNDKPFNGPKFIFTSNKSDNQVRFVADLDDTGDYKCNASNKLGSDSKTIHVEVQKLPLVKIMVRNPIDAEYNEPLNITCEVLGYPKPSIVWMDLINKSELAAEIEEKHKYHIISYIKIEKVTKNATYLCKANNTLGADKKVIIVRTVRKPFFNVTESPEDKVHNIKYHDTYKFECKVDAYPPAKVYWYKNGMKITKNDTSISAGGFELTIKNMQPTDAGKFMCVVENSETIIKYPFKVQISGFVKPTITKFSKTLNIPENNNTTISCRIENGTPVPSIEWYYKDNISDKFIQIKEAKDQEDLKINRVKRVNQGTYMCVATNDAGNDTMETNLIVEYSPTIKIDTGPITTQVGVNFTLPCSADGVPDPIIIWSKDDKPLDVSKYTVDSNHSLTFIADFNDTGNYECEATNKLGSDAKIVHVEVTKAPSVTINGSDTIDAEYNEPLNLTCEVLAYPIPSIVWTDISSKSEIETEIVVKLPYHFISYLNIEKVTVNATYKCKANNTHGVDKKEITIRTVRKPFFNVSESPEDKVHNIKYHDTYKFECKVDAYPPAKVNWYKNGMKITKNDTSISADGFELTIMNMQPTDAGQFMCEVENSDTIIKYPFKVQISGFVKPSITKFSKTLYIPENNNTTISCRIENGTPVPSIEWYYKDNISDKFIQIKEAKDQEDLKMNRVKRVNQGTYICVATNDAGNDTMETNLIVEYSPTIKIDTGPITTQVGVNFTLLCSADGVPDPIIRWSKDDKPLDVSKYTVDSNHSLTFIADFNDTGNYECEATNKLGSDAEIVHVEVTKPPSVTINGSDTIDAEYNEPMNLTCEVLAYPMPSIVWTDISSKSEIETEIVVKLPYHFISYLNIEKVILNATYKCKANNTHGEDKKEITIRTVRKPFFNVSESPEDKVHNIKYHDTYKFECKVDAYPPAKVYWYKNGMKITKNDTSVSADGFELTIKNMQPTDAGQFMCEVENSDKIIKYPFKVQISGFVKPTITKFSKTLNIPENNNTTISCRIENGTPVPSIVWYYKDNISDKFIQIKEAKDQEDLKINRVKRVNQGTYMCVATNDAGNDTMETNLIVEYSPTIKIDTGPITTQVGVNFTLLCSADGVPDPIIRWSKDDKPLDVSKYTVDSNHSLTFIADFNDTGNYECEATNKLGSDAKVVHVEVTKPPSVTINGSDTIDAEYNEPLNLTCEVLAYPMPSIVWTDISSKSEIETEIVVKLPYHFISYLNIEKVTVNATYKCKANNTHGVDKKEITIRTVRKPFFNVSESPEDKVHNIKYHDTYKFTCKVDAYPPAKVYWYKNGMKITKNDTSISADGFELTIKNMQPTDAGQFMCKVENSVTIIKYPFKIQISGFVKPTITKNSKTLNIPENNNTTISCRIEKGTPEPSIEWYYKDDISDKFIQIKEAKDQEDLKINKVKRVNQGTYMCVATNDAGNDTMETNIIVEYSPTIKIDTGPITTQVGVNFTLPCSADGVPDPIIRWSKDDKPLDVSKYTVDSNQNLTFIADFNDTGNYECEATNKLGSDAKIVHVEVTKAPSVTINGSDTIDAEYNEPMNLTCEVLAYPMPSIVWTGISSKSEIETEIVVKLPYYFISYLNIEKVTVNATYKCKANNTHGEDKKEITIRTVRKPFFNVSESPEDKVYNIKYNDTYKLTCKVDAYPPAKVYWYKNGMKITKNDTSISADGFELTIKNMQPADAGKFMCEAKNDNTISTYPFKVQISGVVVPKIRRIANKLRIPEKNSTHISCRIEKGTPWPSIKWYYKENYFDKLTEIIDAKDQEDLSINNIKIIDQGTYMCVATNVAGNDSLEVDLIVEYAPFIVNNIESVTALAGHLTNLTCVADGIPAPVIKWTKDGIPFRSKYIRSSDQSLRFVKDVYDRGVYICNATNALGTAIKTIQVEVEKPPTVTIDGGLKQRVDYDANVQLKCIVEGYPAPDIRWLDTTSLVTLYGSVSSVKLPYKYLSVLNINKANKNSSYQCEAKNVHGVSSATVVLETASKPYFNVLDKPIDVSIPYNKEGHLHCKVNAYPPVTITWFYKSVKVIPKTNGLEVLSDGTLSFKNIQPNQKGEYTCMASNGKVTKTYSATVSVSGLEPPKIFKATNKPVKIWVREGDNVTLACNITKGVPEPTIKWLYKSKSTKKFLEIITARNQNTYLVRNISKGDAVNYACEAKNILGSDSIKMGLVFEFIKIKTSGDKYQTINEHEKMELTCKGIGKPVTKIKWLYEGTADNPKNQSLTLDEDNYTTLEINDLLYDHRGRYTCIASNSIGGQRSFTYEIDVCTDVEIVHNKDECNESGCIVRAVDGDRGFRIHCNATGHPKLYYRWTIDGVTKSDSDTIVIHDVNRKTTPRSYFCQAKTVCNLNTVTYTLVIQDYPSLDNPNSTLAVELGDTVKVDCPVPHNKSDFLRWYRNYKKIKEGELFIYNAKATNAGIYTCRVSNNTNSESANVIVKVGSKLRFRNTKVETNLSLELGQKEHLDCAAIGDPFPKVSWTLNGKFISTKVVYTLIMDPAKVGTYRCEATNDIDTISRIFDVSTSECLLKINPESKWQPLILAQSFTWPTYKYDDTILYMPKHQSILLICLNESKFNYFDSKYVYAYCNKTNKLEIDGNAYDYADLQCTGETKPRAKWTGLTCYGADSELVKIGYEFASKYIEVYEVCMDLSNDIPFYAKLKMHLPLADSTPKVKKWFDDRFNYNYDRMYDHVNQCKGISSLIGRWFHKDDRCVFTERQLVNPLDVFPGLPQSSTFTHLNVVPHWSTCSTKNWDDVESRVRSLVSSDVKLIVWTGVAENLTLTDPYGAGVNIYISDQDDPRKPSQPVSKYLWKVVQNPEKRSSLAIIQLNVPDLTQAQAMQLAQRKCRDICKYTAWMNGDHWHDVSKGYVFCCVLKEFEDAFGYKGLFGYLYNTLYN